MRQGIKLFNRDLHECKSEVSIESSAVQIIASTNKFNKIRTKIWCATGQITNKFDEKSNKIICYLILLDFY